MFKIFTYEIGIIEVIDLIFVLILLYQLYRLVKGTLGINIFFGMLIIYFAYIVARILKLEVLSGILGQFVNAGVIALLIVFQPEVRRFLLQIGKAGVSDRGNLFDLFRKRNQKRSQQQEQDIMEINNAVQHFSDTKTGALLVFFSAFKLHDLNNAGVKINGDISAKLLESIFVKTSPLHDGAVIISRNKIVFAGTVLPLSESADVPGRAGLRHRAAIGITEHTDAIALIVSEETGYISYTIDGKIKTNISEDEMRAIIREAVKE